MLKRDRHQAAWVVFSALPKVSLRRARFITEYREIAVASSAPPMVNPKVLIQRRLAKRPIMMPPLAIMNLTV
jgi:hypothetical protein